MAADEQTLTLWRPVGPTELELIQQTGMRALPPRLPEQPIFYARFAQSSAQSQGFGRRSFMR
jgi:hypothetical protein